MGNGLCPECGCELGYEEIPCLPDENGDPQIVELTYTCPECGFWAITYED